MRLLRSPFASVAVPVIALWHPAMLWADGAGGAAPIELSLRTAVAVAIMVAIGIVVGWMLGRLDER